MSRPQQKPRPGPQSAHSGRKVVESGEAVRSGASDTPKTSAPNKAAAKKERASEVAASKRLHPARVWPD
jgi:hypothetical protein